MQELEVKIMRVDHDGVNINIPRKATMGSAGFDLYAAITEKITINPRQLVRIPTGIAISLPSDQFVGLVFARSGLAIKHGISLSNGVGVVDSDYTGEILVGLCNLSDNAYNVEPQERIAQLVVMPVPAVNFCEVQSLEKTERSDNGFGSTGKY